MLTIPLSMISPAGQRARLTILIFHRVVPQADPLMPDLPDSSEFERLICWVREWFNVLPLGEAVRRLRGGDLPARALAITFDDGYADNETIVVPILRRLGLTATFFVCPGFLDGGRMWNDDVIESLRLFDGEELDLSFIGLETLRVASLTQRRQAIDRVLTTLKHRPYEERARSVEGIVNAVGGRGGPQLMMTRAQVKRLSDSGMEVGGHTLNHPILAMLPPRKAQAEIAQGKEELERILGQRIFLFAYPNGLPGRDYSAAHVAMVKDCGFSAAVSTAWGVSTRSSDPYQLPRFTPWDRSRWRFFGRLVQNALRRRHAVA